jgi:hypothetical protein
VLAGAILAGGRLIEEDEQNVFPLCVSLSNYAYLGHSLMPIKLPPSGGSCLPPGAHRFLGGTIEPCS